MPGLYLAYDAAIELLGLVVVDVERADGLASGRQFVDDGHIEVAVERHCQSARDGCGGHDEDVGSLAFLPQLGSLCYAEAVLLVDDDESETAELHVVLDDGMRAYQDVDASVLQTFLDGFAALALDVSCQQFDADGHLLEERAERLQVLLGKNLGWGHDACLATVVDGDEHYHECHECLAAAHVALQQAVHLPAALHVGMHLADDALLCFGQGKGQVFAVECVEEFAHTGEALPDALLLTSAGIGHDDELDEEEFLELQPHVGRGKLVGCGGVVCGTKGFVEWHEVQPFGDVVGQRFGNRPGDLAEERTREAFQRARSHACLLHAFRCGVVGLHAHLAERGRFRAVEVGMVDAEPAAIDAGAAEEDVILVHLHALLDVADALEPSDIEEHLSVPEVAGQPVLAPLACFLEAAKLSHDLHEGHLRRQLAYLVEAAAVDVLVGKRVQEVAPSLDAQLGLQQFRPLRADARQVGYGSF